MQNNNLKRSNKTDNIKTRHRHRLMPHKVYGKEAAICCFFSFRKKGDFMKLLRYLHHRFAGTYRYSCKTAQTFKIREWKSPGSRIIQSGNPDSEMSGASAGYYTTPEHSFHSIQLNQARSLYLHRPVCHCSSRDISPRRHFPSGKTGALYRLRK